MKKILFLLIFIPSFSYGDFTRIVRDANPIQLENEIYDIPGFPERGLSCYYQDPGGVLVYYSGDLSTEMQAAVDLVISRHVPNWQDRTDDQDIKTLEDALKAVFDNWDIMSQAQKFAAIKNFVRLEMLRVRRRR